MAGGKETPRQKMIGMMYLVLTALLALNVSVTVLDKFIDINNSLEVSVDAAKEQNGNTLRRIENAVEESGSRPDDVKILDKAKEIRQKTREMVNELATYKETFVKITGDRDENGDLVGKTDYDRVSNYMLPENENNGIALQKELNEYSKYIDQAVGDSAVSFDLLALDANENPRFQNDPNQKGKDWATLEFMGSPTPAALATISDYQNKVMAYESRALDLLARKVGAGDLKFDLIRLVALPESKVVAAGAKYKADLIVAASSSAEDPEMTFNGNEIDVENGNGKIEFTVTPAGSYGEEGTARKTYEATAKLKDSVYREEIEYFVAEPVIQVQSAALSQLYLNCGNELDVLVPALGTSYNPSFSVQGGTSIQGQARGRVTIIPNAPKVTLGVSSGSTKIGNKVFDVRRIPKPDVQVFAGSKPVNLKQGEKATALRVLRVEAIPDDNFKAQLPKDAQYKVTRWTITLARGPRPVGQPIKATSETVNISQLMSNARPGDRLVVQVDQVLRRNFRGNTEEVALGEQVFPITLN
ncbi:gliding motility protein GldM [Marivirga harenae]|uniref:type IX secretion system motor protein PorM/GldM n=1 Tax=Marivirga harenae TaxID=2010992 RepID=UPI0026DFBC06|nr:gliding motility protein GldM [Marivirga harenae]WKV13478.1 gliding motility protein GldM [Marivirga harenae]|tara:strand:+ start:94249 stop:95835 length:1587 start_codon:yes stop_codon:yes gene_type:complete